ncbi:uncharacterized protein LOC115216622 [Octopus sinensis]|uniref:Uncharacterized protein LOC115216621 n=1 Tax=Octopus sinensis TaxID=2607531 RepID=A0A6P7SUP4_9MOLL|nr:uncharacterized protein LOC115216621 [Octopus sinensis]XP_029641964.1 uncharacterized protein LOC115216622 [Octopus sinensis]
MQKYLILACCFLIFNAGRSQARSIKYDRIRDYMSTMPRDIIGKNMAMIPDYPTMPAEDIYKKSMMDIIGKNMAMIPDYATIPADAYNKRSIKSKKSAMIADYATIPADAYNKRSMKGKKSAMIADYATIPADASIMQSRPMADHYIQEIRMGMKDIDFRPVTAIPPNIALRPIETIGKKSAIADYAAIPAEDIYKKSMIDKIGKNMAMIPDYAAIPADAYSMRSMMNYMPTEYIYEIE